MEVCSLHLAPDTESEMWKWKRAAVYVDLQSERVWVESAEDHRQNVALDVFVSELVRDDVEVLQQTHGRLHDKHSLLHYVPVEVTPKFKSI